MTLAATQRAINGLGGIEPIDVEPQDLPAAIAELLAAAAAVCRWPMPGIPGPAGSSCAISAAAASAKISSCGAAFRAAPVPSAAAVSPLLGWYEREIDGSVWGRVPRPPGTCPPGAAPGRAADPAAPRPKLPGRYEAAVRARRRRAPRDRQCRCPAASFWARARGCRRIRRRLIFLYVGEHIIHFHPQLFFKHRGMEKRFEGRSLPYAVVLGRTGVRRRQLLRTRWPSARRWSRRPAARCRPARDCCARSSPSSNGSTTTCTISGHLAHTTTLKVGEAEGKLLEERAKQINGRLTGSRFLRSLLIPGGLRRDTRPEALVER